MPLLQGYTIAFINNECRKIMIHFIDPNPSEYELIAITRFFKNKKVFINYNKKQINFMIMDWQLWVSFLLNLGFKDTAKAVCNILNDLEKNYEIEPMEYLEKIAKAKIIK